jgi:chloramphenicol 3-O phosphotransferase
MLPDPWLVFSIDNLVDAMPPGIIDFPDDGAVVVGDAFRALESAWMAGIAATALAGANVIVDDVFLSGADSQRRWRDAFAGRLDVRWVGVRCAAEVAAARERARGDRTAGMAASQAELVHQGVVYDLVVDTAETDTPACARIIAARLG